MKLGEKIKQARLERRMTQKDVVGDYITRNMLSKIENGSATPSIKTLEHLASVLGLQPGYFMADLESGEEIGVDGARTAYRRGEFKKALELINCEFERTGAIMSDEAALLAAKCCTGIAREAMKQGELDAARAYAREGLKHSQSGVYTDPRSEVECCQILMMHLTRTAPERRAEYDRYATRMRTAMNLDGLAERVSMIEALRDGSLTDRRVSPGKLTDDWSRAVYYFMRGHDLMAEGRVVSAIEQYEAAEREAEAYGGKLLRSDIYTALEQAHSKNDDFKQAYVYASKRLEL